MRALVAALALLIATPAAGRDAFPAGVYIISQMEMGGGLMLRPDGTFLYQLEYGAASETASGKWTEIDGTIRLTSDPTPKAPRFVVVEDKPAPKGELYVTLDSGKIDWPRPLEVIVGLPDLQRRDADEDGRIDTGGVQPVSVTPMLPVYDMTSQPHPLDPATGHHVRFRFEPNDLGRIDFRCEPLAIDGESLVMQRYGTTIRLRPTAD